MSQLAFHFDADKCMLCRVCVIACKDKNELKPGRKFRRVYANSTGAWTLNTDGVYEPQDVIAYSVSVACNHCEKPACQSSCPANAIGKREDGIVFIDRTRCIGCGNCAAACPYSAPSMDKDTMKMDKCDFCRDLTANGEAPACVAACSMQALNFGELDVLKVLYPNAVQQVAPLEGPEKTNPSLLITPHNKYNSSMTVTSYNMPEELQANEA